MKLEGKVVKLMPIESGVSKAGKGWRKQSLVIDNGSEWNPEVCISFFGDEKIDMIAALNAGDDVAVSVNVSSRAWNDKYFHSIDGWRVETGSQSVPTNASLGQDNMVTSDDSDLPF